MIAVDDINKAGGILGRPLKVVTADTKSDINQGAQAGLSVISKGADVMLVTLDFNFGGPAARVAQSKGMVAMSIGAGSPKFGVQGIGPLAYTIGSNGDVEAYAEAEWAYQKKHWRTAYLLLDDTTDANRTQCSSFATRWKELGGTIVGQDTFKNTDPSVAPQITRLKGALEGTRRDRALLVPAGRRRRDPADPPAGDQDADHRQRRLRRRLLVQEDDPGSEQLLLQRVELDLRERPESEGQRVLEEVRAGDEGAAAGLLRGVRLHGGAGARASDQARRLDRRDRGRCAAQQVQERAAAASTSFTKSLHIDTHRAGRIMEIQNGKHTVAAVVKAQEQPPLSGG